MFIVVVHITAKVGSEERLASALRLQASRSLEREEDCHVFEVCRAPNDGQRFLLYEKYSTPAAFELHLESDHFLAFDEESTPLMSEKTVETWEELGVAR